VPVDLRAPWQRILPFAVGIFLPFAAVALGQSQSPLLPGTKPLDASPEWKQLVGIYEYNSLNSPKQTMIVFERDQHLFMRPQDPKGKTEEIRETNGVVLISDPGGREFAYTEHRDESARVTSFSYLVEHFIRTDPGSDSAHAYHIKPVRPVAELRAETLTASPPHEDGAFRKADLVELAPLDASIHLDIRYATSNDFLGTPVYSQARAFLQRPAAEALLRVQQKLKPLGYGLLIHDAYRPWYVTKIFWDATPPEGKIFVADPAQGSRHNRGCAVDLTLYDLATGKSIEMPGTYDEMSPRSFPDYPGGTSLQRWHRDLLRRAMESEGFTVYEAEWWHFDYKDWKEYAISNVPFEKIELGHAPAAVHQ
jgi:D-alanyl-D-alanine dipeptidase